MKFDIIRANQRGHFNFGWLDTHHTFSFGEYHNRERIHFGALRVVNDDIIAPQSSFPLHSHQNMEIITLVLAGSVEHQDNLGNKTIICAGEIQTMCAGSGILHSEANPSYNEELSLFQIWIHPRQRNLTPSYAQRNFSDQLAYIDQWQLLISPDAHHDRLQINQEAYLALGEFQNPDKVFNYTLHNSTHGVFIMVISGQLNLAEHILHNRDAIMLRDCTEVNFTVNHSTRVLLIEVPLTITL